MHPVSNRREFLKKSSLLPLCAAAGFGLAHASRASAASAQPVRAGRSNLKLSLNAYSFNELLLNAAQGRAPAMSLFELLEFCVEHGFDAVDPTGYYFPGYPAVPEDAFLRKFKRHAHRLGVAISGTGVRNNFASPNAEARAADIRLVRAWVEVAARLGAPALRVFAGAVPAGYENRREEVVAWMLPAFRECVAHGEKHGVIIGVQNHSDMLQTAEQTLQVVDAVGSEWFGVIVDTGGMKTADPYADIARVIPHAVNWQVKESPVDRNSPVRTDLPRLFKLIKEGGYHGYVPIETLPVDGTPYDPRVVVPRFAAEVRAAMAAVAAV
jgi:sugar phosphate isomerase/epimerase